MKMVQMKPKCNKIIITERYNKHSGTKFHPREIEKHRNTV